MTMTVKREERSGTCEERTLLVTFLRDPALTGTHVGCDTSQCGACVVHLNGDSVKACTLLAAQAEGAEITMIEGVADGEIRHPIQQAFHENQGLQCGYCTPGMIGNFQVRNRDTIGGSIANADPAADYSAALVGLGATVSIDRREIAADDCFLDLFETTLEDGELVTAVTFPKTVRAACMKFPNRPLATPSSAYSWPRRPAVSVSP